MTTTNADTYDNPMPHAQLAAVRRFVLEFGANFTRDAIVRTVEGTIADHSGGFPAGGSSAIVELHPPTEMDDP
ncbi:hypothetical protein ACFTWF_31040 [Rhodococcus sp. NPDC056960]|uniref:hypothetical protein n=1 Tax=Rhodococcus sp. NPDC056960 TaxID=3345982 RepID=UPI00362F8FFA